MGGELGVAETIAGIVVIGFSVQFYFLNKILCSDDHLRKKVFIFFREVLFKCCHEFNLRFERQI